MRLRVALAAMVVMGATPAAGVPAAGGGAPHDLHASYGDLGVEGKIAILRVRLFKDDLATALAAHSDETTVVMEANPLVDRLFLDYFGEHYTLEVGGQALSGRIVESGEDTLDREPVWWYTIRFDAPEPIASGRIRNTLLFEVFGDQRNLVKLVHFPDESSRTFYFAPGEEWVEFSLGESSPTDRALTP